MVCTVLVVLTTAMGGSQVQHIEYADCRWFMQPSPPVTRTVCRRSVCCLTIRHKRVWSSRRCWKRPTGRRLPLH
jgi:hypothetical protein